MSLAEDLRRSGRLAITRPDIVYLGYSGRGNVGDDALLEANRRLIAPAVLSLAPISGPVLDRLVTGPWPRLATHTLLIGGGTLIGRPDWRSRIERLRMLMPEARVLVSGAGVEEPEFSGARTYASDDELRAWAPLLSSGAGVRGPRSARLLARVGVEATVVGDPVLALGPDRPWTRIEDDLIGLNVAWPEDVYGGDRSAVVRQLANGLAALLERGYRVRIVPMETGDVEVSRALVADLPARWRERVEVPRLPRNAAELIELLAPCSVVVGQRLHTMIAAHAAFVPALSIAYRPKCFDHLDAIGRPEWALRSDEITADVLVALVESVRSDRAEQVRHLRTRVGELRQRLHEQARLVNVRPA